MSFFRKKRSKKRGIHIVPNGSRKAAQKPYVFSRKVVASEESPAILTNQ
jgi:hypothetical protein